MVGKGLERVTVRTRSGLQIEFRFFEEESFGSALLYFTGSKAHNIELRKRAQQRGLKLSKYGLFKGKKRIAGRTEGEVYEKLGLAFIPPKLREDRGEIKAAKTGELPRLVELGDIRGDLHAPTDATDGTATLEEMAEAALARGYEYLAITEHSKAVRVAHGLDERRLRKYADRIRELDAKLKGIRLLAGVEVDILRDGRLDLDECLRAELDWVVASVHYDRNLAPEKMTERILRAVQSGVVHCIGHPIGRLIGRREALRFDLDRIFEACVESGVCLEIDAQPDRLDLPDAYVKQARDMGVRFVIASDAHKPSDFDLMELGVYVARRGWLEKRHVLNTRPLGQLMKAL